MNGLKALPQNPLKDICKNEQDQGSSRIDLQRALVTGIFTTSEAAYFLGVSKKTIWNWKCEGRIRAMTLGKGRRLRFHISELEKILRG